eukprot:gene5305-5540_t
MSDTPSPGKRTSQNFLHTTWLLNKRLDGSIGWLSIVAFWPYHLALRGKLYIQRRKSLEPLYNKVTSNLYIGGWPEQDSWLPQGAPSVVDVTSPSPVQIQQGVEWVQRELADGRSVYVHCAHGHGRSATVLAAVLIATGQAATAEQAVALMRAARPRVRLNGPQAAALRAWIAQRQTASQKETPAAVGRCMAASPVAGGRADVSVTSPTAGMAASHK